MSSFDDADTRFFKGQVGAHVHEWYLQYGGHKDSSYLWAKCRGCSKMLSGDAVQRRLNAVEQLSATGAANIAKFYHHTLGSELADQLVAYASALEQ